MKVIIDGRKVKCSDDFYDEISRQLKFPDYFGRNLNALWDVLSSHEVGVPDEEIAVVWRDSQTSKIVMKKDYEAIVDVLRDAAKEVEGFKFQEE